MMKKRLLAGFLTVTMLVSLFPLPALAAEVERPQWMVTAFDPLDENTAAQTVSQGGGEPVLPDTLTAWVYHIEDDTDVIVPPEGAEQASPEGEQPLADGQEEPPTTGENGGDTLTAVLVENDPAPANEQEPEVQQITIPGVTWTAEPEYDPNTPSAYIYTPVLPAAYAVSEGVELPAITVTVKAVEPEQTALQRVQAMIDALPDGLDITLDNRAEVEAQLEAIGAAWAELSDEDALQLDTARCEAAQEALAVLEKQESNDLPTTLAEGDVAYLNRRWDETTKQVVTEAKTVSNPTAVTTGDTTWGVNDNQSHWYVVEGKFTIPQRVTVTGDVHLILADDCNLIISGGIGVSEGNNLTIYGQSGGTGKLTANATKRGHAGIGGTGNGGGGNITINGGNVNSIGGKYGAGIGNGENGSTGGSVTINGGTVTADGGFSSSAGIGGGSRSAGVTITIRSGTVIANNYIGDGKYSTTEGSFSTGENGSAFIIASAITGKTDKGMWSGVIFEGDSGQVYGCPTIQTDAEIPSGKTLTVSSGITLNASSGVTLKNCGIIKNEGTINVTLTNEGSVVNSGTISAISNNGFIFNNGNSATINGISTNTGTIYNNGGNVPSSSADRVINVGAEKYIDGNQLKAIPSNATFLLPATAINTWNNGYYVVCGAVKLTPRVTVSGNVHLILMNGSSLTATGNRGNDGGISVNEGNSLTIYAQSTDESTMGALTAAGWDNAAIGGDAPQDAGTITINGGKVTATGNHGGAGIGGGSGTDSTDGGSGGRITINGGIVEAKGSSYSNRGSSAGIGGGSGAGTGYIGGSPGTITITGGKVTASGDSAGIGGGSSSNANTTPSGTITINGGEVEASGSVGIGDGSSSSTIKIEGSATNIIASGIVGHDITIQDGAIKSTGGSCPGIGGSNSTVTIRGGDITATGGGSSAGIGSYGGNSPNGTITIKGGSVTAKGASGGAGIGGGAGSSAGKITISDGTVTVDGGGEYAADIGCGKDWYSNKPQDVQGTDQIIIDENVTVKTGNGESVKVSAAHGPDLDKWAKNETQHWHVCRVAGCTDTSHQTSAVNHTEAQDWQHSETQHWHLCSVCQEAITSTKENHNWDGTTCTDCQAVRGAKPTVSIDYANETLSTTTALEYSADGGANWQVCSANMVATSFGNWNGSTAVEVQFRTKTTDSAYASEAQEVTIPARPATPSNLQGVKTSFAGESDGKITGLTGNTAYQISKDNGSWEDKTSTSEGTITGLSTGSYQVRVKATAGAFVSEASEAVQVGSGPQRTYTLTVTAPTFDTVTYGYAQPDAKAITITSSGNSDATISSVTVSGDNFTISGSGNTVTAGGSITTRTIQPNAGLNVGTYTGTITVTYNGNATAKAEVSFTVNKKAEATPSISINYQNETLTGFDAGASYTINGTTVTLNGGTFAVANYMGQTISIVRTARDANYTNSSAQSLPIPARPTAPTAPLKLTKAANSITVTNTGSYSGCEFSTDGMTWNDTGAFTSLTAGQTYPVSVRTKATGSAFASASQTVSVTTVKADGSTTVKPGESVTTGGTTITNDGEKTTITGGGTTTTVTPPAGGGDVNVGTGGGVTVPGGSTVKTGDDGPEITVGDKGGTVGGGGGITIPGGGTAQTGNPATTITVPESGGTIQPKPGGSVTVPGGSTVQTGDNGPEITVGDKGGTVGGGGGITVPDDGTIQTGSPATTITPPNGGEVKPKEDGTIEVPSGTTVKPGDGGPEITVGPGNGGTVGDDGGVTVEGGGKVTVKGNPDNTTITLPSSGGTVKPNPDGTVSLPGGSEVQKGGGTTVTVPDGSGTYNPTTGEVTYTVTFDSQGGSAVSSIIVTLGEKVTKPSNPTKSGYTFDGWYKESGCTTAWNFDSDTVTGNITLYAKWTQNSGGGGGGTYTPPTYPPTVEKPIEGGGTPSTSPSNPKQGDTVTVTPKPDSGYEVGTIIVTDRNGKPVEVTQKPDGTYTFKQPSGKVTIKVTYQPIDRPWNNPFTDVSEGDWYYEAVRFVQERGLMNGYSDGRFGPNDNLSRAQLAQILFNKEGRPGVNYLMDFSDVAGEAWYTEAIRWATSQGIVGGYGNGTFGPNDPITREQLAVMLWRYVGSPAATNKELHFNDTDEISPFALEAMRWAVENGILNGYGDGRLGPQGQATRAQVAQMLKNFIENQEEENT